MPLRDRPALPASATSLAATVPCPPARTHPFPQWPHHSLKEATASPPVEPDVADSAPASTRFTTSSRLAADLQKLTTASRFELAQLWHSQFGQPPPKAIGRKLMMRALAYTLQVEVLGGLSKHTQRTLMAIGSARPDPLKGASRSLQPGTRLVRDWHGRTYVVEVLESGFLWNGSRQRSLSAIARAITGARWSGRRFFGL